MMLSKSLKAFRRNESNFMYERITTANLQLGKGQMENELGVKSNVIDTSELRLH